MLKRQYFAPSHLFVDDTPYFITGAIHHKRNLLAHENLKIQLLNLIQQTFQVKDWELHHWVILDNHYHIMGRSRKGRDLTNIIRKIHSKSALWIREATSCETPVWWNYWDYCPRNEKDYLIRLNYLLTNPIKHGYVNHLHDYPYSSFHSLFNEKGPDVFKQFNDYPKYQELKIEEDNF
jgi:putative transposase